MFHGKMFSTATRVTFLVRLFILVFVYTSLTEKIMAEEMITDLELSMENSPIVTLQWNDVSNHTLNDSMAYRIDVCSLDMIFKAVSDCKIIGVAKVVFNSTKQSFNTSTHSVDVDENKDIAVRVTQVFANSTLVGSSGLKIIGRLNQTTVPLPPTKFHVKKMENSNETLTTHEISWELPEGAEDRVYIFEYMEVGSTESLRYFVSQKNASNAGSRKVDKSQLLQLITRRPSYELNKFNIYTFRYLRNIDKESDVDEIVDVNMMSFTIHVPIRTSYFIRFAVYNSSFGAGPFSETVKYDACPYKSACHGFLCKDNFQNQKRHRDCACQCTLENLIPYPWDSRPSPCTRHPYYRGKYCRQNPICQSSTKCGDHECINECNSCFPSCKVSRYSNSFPRNPRLVSKGYRFIEVEWDELNDIKEGEEKIYLIETYITEDQHGFLKRYGRTQKFERTVPRLRIDNLITSTKIRFQISLKSRRDNNQFEVSNYFTVWTKEVQDTRIDVPGKVTDLEVITKEDNSIDFIQWNTPENIWNSDDPDVRSLQYSIQFCKFHPIFKTEDCDNTKPKIIVVGDPNSYRQFTKQNTTFMFPFDMEPEKKQEIIVKVTPEALSFEEGPTTEIILRLDTSSVPYPPTRFRLKKVDGGKQHEISWEVPEESKERVYILEHQSGERSNDTKVYFIHKNNASYFGPKNVSSNSILTLPKASKHPEDFNYNLNEINKKKNYPLILENTPTSTNSTKISEITTEMHMMSFRINVTIENTYYVRLAVHNSQTGSGPFSETIKYERKTSSSVRLGQGIWILIAMWSVMKLLV